jgi:hypothetical protein
MAVPSELSENVDHPLVRDHVTWPADVVLHPDHPVAEADARMRARERPAAPVVDGDAIVGMLSPNLLAGIPEGQPRLVHDCMVTTIPFLYLADPLALGAAIVSTTRIEHFCVVDREHLLVGLLSFADPGNRDPSAGSVHPVDPGVIRRRLAVTPGRAAGADFGVLATYAEGPTLYVHGRAAYEPLDRPWRSLRRRREVAMQTKV